MEVILFIMFFIFGLIFLINVTTNLLKEKFKFNSLIIISGVGMISCIGLLAWNKYMPIEINFVEAIKESASDSSNLSYAIMAGVVVFIISALFQNRNRN